ncbi:hypothetical protein Q1695_006622 [Nippostrongylus brasiliensis]|nr:hypothetical protein Q1695_006622 [Nippostrongylus brasiliensis]
MGDFLACNLLGPLPITEISPRSLHLRDRGFCPAISQSETTCEQILPQFDYGIVDCIHELLFNRTFHGQTNNNLDSQFYRNLVYVRYHTRRKMNEGNITVDC